MSRSKYSSNGQINQYLISISLILIIAITSYSFPAFFGYRIVALVLLLTVSILAMLFDILPVLFSAILSACIWNLFFIPPVLTFAIGLAEDTLLFIMYFVVAMINAVLSFKIRDFQQKAREKEEKEKTIRLYNTLLNSLSHELRTPIATVIGAIDTIKENSLKLSENHKHELYNEIEIAGFRLNRQVENLLNMSRLEAGVLMPNSDWCDVNELVYAVIKDNKEGAMNHLIEFRPNEKLPLFKIDRGILEQVLHNIFHNALQYTPVHSIITIEVFHKNRECHIAIFDNGPGIPEKDLKTIFDKFYRLSRHHTGGTGLGLSIAKGFTESLGGSVQVENRPTGGAKFTIIIPAERSSINSIKDE